MRRLILCGALVLWLAAPSTVQAKSDVEKMNEGNDAYRAGNWSLAIENYSSVSVNNPDLFYNLANAHFKNEEVGKAILYYNRALRIKPRDKEIRANLEYARLSRTDKTQTKEKNGAVKMAEAIFSKISMNEQAALSIAIFTLLASLLFASISLPDGDSRAKLKNGALIVAIVLALQLTVTGIKTYSESVIKHGVVTIKTAEALSSPSTDSRKLFELHDGTELIMGRAENGYVQIELPTGWIGWLPTLQVEAISAKRGFQNR